jgi:hypothetical protein
MLELPNVSVGDGTISLIALTALYGDIGYPHQADAFTHVKMLLGVYLVLFVLAIWSTYLRPNSVSLPMRYAVLSL